MREWWAKLLAVVRCDRLDEDLRAEVEAHLEMEVEAHIERGMSPQEALKTATRQFGSRRRIHEASREQWLFLWCEATLQDLRFGLRQLLKHPGFACTAICVLALGIAGVVAILGFVDAALIRPLPYQDPSRLVTAFSTRPDRDHGQPKSMVSYLNFLEWRARNRVFISIGAFDVRPGFILTTPEGSHRVPGLRVTSGFFRTLGVTPVLGREFQRDEEGPAAVATVVLSHQTWRDRFDAKPDVLGKTVTLQGEAHVVIGVLPPDFHFPMAGHAEFWTAIRGPQPCWESRGCRSLETIARLGDGVAVETAQASLNDIIQQLHDEDRDPNPETAMVVPLSEVIFRDIRPVMLMLLGGAGLLLLIACINVASLLLARSESRTREIAVRHALGASSSRLAMQFGTEAVILIAIGGLFGLALAALGMRALSSLLSADMMSRMPYFQGLGVNIRLVAFTSALSVGAAAVFALTPLMRMSATKQSEALKEGNRGSAGIAWRRLGRSLVVAELAIAVILLAGSGLLSKSIYRLLHVDTGFDTGQLAMVIVSPVVRPASVDPAPTPHNPEQPGGSARQVAQRVATLPGIQAVAYADVLPLAAGLAPSSGFQVPGRAAESVIEDHPVRRISAGYFRALQVTLLDGRFFTEDEVVSRRDVVILNETATKRYFSGEDAVGKQIVIGAPPARRIVGVVADIKDGPLETPAHPAAYIPFDQVSFGLLARTSQPEHVLVPSLTNAIRAIRSDLLVQGATTMTEHMNRAPSVQIKRASAWLVGGFAATALALSLIGLYGVVAYAVGQRARELGVRMALGAQRRSVYRLVMGEAAGMVVAGIALGLMGAVVGATLMGNVLFGVQPWDLSTLVAAAAALAVPALLASVLPARRAASVDPIEVLCAE